MLTTTRSPKYSLFLLCLFNGICGQLQGLELTDFVREPEVYQVTQSPSGDHLAIIQKKGSQAELIIHTPEEQITVEHSNLTKDPAEPSNAIWLDDDTLLFKLFSDYNGRYCPLGLFSYQLSTRQTEEILPWPLKVIDTLPQVPGVFLVAADPENKGYADAYRVNLQAVSIDKVAENPGNIYIWFADKEGHVRIGVGASKGQRYTIIRESESSPWQAPDFFKYALPLGFTQDSQKIYSAYAVKHDKLGLVAHSLTSPKGYELMALSQTHDILPNAQIARLDELANNALFYCHQSKDLCGLFYQAEKPQVYWFSQELARLQKQIDKHLPDTFNRITQIGSNNNNVLITSYSDRHPGSWHRYFPEDDRMEDIAETMPWITPEAIAPTQNYAFINQYGTKIYNYLTLPLTGKKKPPLVVLLHGGPRARDTWGYDPEAQFLASLGYAVLKINYSGSSGHGRKLTDLTYEEICRRSVTDVANAVDALSTEGRIDPQKVVIMGWSFGGYISAASLQRFPNRYRGGVGGAGVYDWTRRNHEAGYRADYDHFFYALSKMHKPEIAIELSPRLNAQAITAPLLLIHGAEDFVVRTHQTTEFARTLEAHGKEHQVIIAPKEGHTWFREKNNLKIYPQIQQFLEKCFTSQ